MKAKAKGSAPRTRKSVESFFDVAMPTTYQASTANSKALFAPRATRRYPVSVMQVFRGIAGNPLPQQSMSEPDQQPRTAWKYRKRPGGDATLTRDSVFGRNPLFRWGKCGSRNCTQRPLGRRTCSGSAKASALPCAAPRSVWSALPPASFSRRRCPASFQLPMLNVDDRNRTRRPAPHDNHSAGAELSGMVRPTTTVIF